MTSTPALAALSRKNAPQYQPGKDYLDADCFGAWAAGRSNPNPQRRLDTWVGVTHLETEKFYFLPTFGLRTGGFSPKPAKPASDAQVLRDTTASSPYTVTPAELQQVYGERVLYVNLAPAGPGQFTFDGQSHRALYRRLMELGKLPKKDVKEIEKEVLGWAIRPMEMANGTFLIRYSSGRNEGKFEPRGPVLKKFDDLDLDELLDYTTTNKRPVESDPAKIEARKKARELREARDLPKAWSAWIRDVLTNKLIVAVEEQITTESWTFKMVECRLESRGHFARATTVGLVRPAF